MKLTIGIKALNEASHIERCLASALAAAAPFAGEVILADSGSTDGTLEKAGRYPVTIVRFADLADRSCGAGAQLAFQYARGDYFYILDGDMEIDPAFMRLAIPFMDAHPEIAGVGGRIEEVHADNHEFRNRRLKTESDGTYFPHPVDRLDCGGLYRTAAVREAGYFADRNLHAFEEFELAARLISQGWTLTRLDAPAARHYGHTMASYALLRRRVASGHTRAPGEVLRGAVGRPHLGGVLRRLSHIRNGMSVMAWWLGVMALAAACLKHPPLAPLAIIAALAPLIVLTLRRGSLAAGCYSFVAWNLTALGLVTGLLARRIPPDIPIAAQILGKQPAVDKGAVQVA